MSSPRERRAERTRQAILDTAVQIISEKGADNLSLREIARRIDYSPAGLYEYFAGKEEIIAAVCEQGNARLKRYMETVPEDLPLVERLIELGMSYIRCAKDYPEQFVFLFSNREVTSAEDFHEEGDSFFILYSTVNGGVESGQLKLPAERTVLELSYSMWALVHGTALLQVNYLQGEIPIDFHATDRFMIETYVRALL